MDLAGVFDLTGRTAVITGAGSGIGRAAAEVLASAGANVVAGDVQREWVDDTVKGIAEAGGKAVAQSVDVSRKDEVDALIDRAVSEFGRLDVMCNVAGIASDFLIAECTEADLDKVIGVNLKGVFFGCQAALRVMTQQHSGSIINVSSSGIDAPVPRYGPYAMTKAAVAMLTMTLATEAGSQGIRVNCIAPGMTITRFTARHVHELDGSVNQERYDAFVKRMSAMSPLGVVGEPIDQAYLILYLASDAAKFCTGQIWRANGGQTMAW